MKLTIVSIDKAGEFFRTVRKDVIGITQEEMKKRTGFSKTRIMGLETGKIPFSQETLEGYESALGIKVGLIVALDPQDMKRLVEAEEVQLPKKRRK